MNKILTTIIFLLTFIYLPVSAQAATLYSCLSSESYTEETFILDVYVSSINESMNVASGTISFPQDKLEVISLSKTESIFDLWTKEPSFSNTNGIINFEGVVLNSDTINDRNKIMSIAFKVKEKGMAQIFFSSGEVLANDGNGTNILKELDSNNILL
jgi:hypothetical protein